jgi:membrane protein insertase Oxa1/YidC/SpoIIIJ
MLKTLSNLPNLKSGNLNMSQKTEPEVKPSKELQKATEPIRQQHQRMFRRNLKMWIIRWTIGFSACAWFTFKFPKHLWLWWFAIGTAALSLLVMYVGNRLISKRFMNSAQKMKELDAHMQNENIRREKESNEDDEQKTPE